MTNLAGSEIELLMEALDAWEREPTGTRLMVGMLSMGLASSEEQAEAAKQRCLEGMDEGATEVKGRKERVILLKAKLIGMRDAVEIDALCESVTNR